MSTFDDLEHDQHAALAELTEVLDVNAGVRDLLQELSDAQAIHQIADVLDLDAGAAAALAAAGLRDADAPPDTTASPGSGDRAVDVPRQQKHVPTSGRPDRSPAPWNASHSFLVRLLATIAALARRISSRSRVATSTEITFAIDSTANVQFNVRIAHPDSPVQPRPSRTLDEVRGEIAALLDVVQEIYTSSSRGARRDAKSPYLTSVHAAGFELNQIMDGLSNRSISLDDALERLRAAETSVQRIRRLARESHLRPVARYWRPVASVLFVLIGATAVILDWKNLIWVAPWLLSLVPFWLPEILGDSLATRRLRAANRALTRAGIGDRLGQLRRDVRRLFEDSDEFSEERASH